MKDMVLTSTSWQSKLELNAISYARSIGKKCISILDHWVNYRERFIREGELILPDEIWVCDNHAFALAKKTFPKIKIQKIKNYDLIEFKDELMQQETTLPAKSFVFE